MTRRVFNGVVILLLLALFIVPNRYLAKVSDALVIKSELAVDAVLREDWDAGLALLQEMNTDLRIHKERVHLFMGHEVVEDIDAALRSCLQLMLVEDQPQSLQGLESVITSARYMKTIEQFSWTTLF